jgi:hypothetical protein
MYCPTVKYIRPRGHPIKRYIEHLLSSLAFSILETSLVTHHIKIHTRK